MDYTKGMKNCVRKWCMMLCKFVKEVTCAFEKLRAIQNIPKERMCQTKLPWRPEGVLNVQCDLNCVQDCLFLVTIRLL